MKRRDLLSSSVLALTLGFASGCAFFERPTIPMAQQRFSAGPEPAKHLMLFLPGLGDHPEDVIEGGLIAEMDLLPQFDSVVADAHFGYYKAGVMTERLHLDIVSELRPRYDEFWIVGTSMGGYGAIAYAEKFPGSVTGLILLAPYLGQNKVLTDIEEAGGLAKWDPNGFVTNDTRTAHGVRVWAWLKEHASTEELPLVYLSTGDDDKLLRSFHLLEPALPKKRIRIIDGGHNWKTWRRLFHELALGPLHSRSRTSGSRTRGQVEP